MAEEKRESSPSLQDLEGGWVTPPPAQAAEKVDAEAPAEDRPSTPDLAAVDEGWLDDLFPGDDGEDEEEEEEEEPELPDERLDPEAYAAAKKARDERVAARREKKKAKLEAKRARQKARAAQARAKQKARSKGKPRPKAQPKPTKASKAADVVSDAAEDGSPSAEEDEVPRKKVPAFVAEPKRGIPTQYKLLAVAIAVFLAAAAFAAALAR